MNAQDRRRARRKAERVALDKGTETAVVASAAAPETTDETPLDPAAALAAVELAAAGKRMPCANCDHAYTDHLGDDGPCEMADCSCKGYAAAEQEAAAVEIVDSHHAVARIALDPSQPFSAPVLLRFTSVDGQPLPTSADLEAFATLTRERPVVCEIAEEADFALPDELAPTESLPRRNPSPRAVTTEPRVAGALKKWTAVLAPEGSPTDDGRVFAPGSMRWRDLPITLMAMLETQEGHDGATVSGRIDRIWRQAGDLMAEGVFDSGEFGEEIARLVADGTLRGVSVDIAVSAMDVLPESEVLDENGQWREGVTKDSVEAASPMERLIGDESERMLYVVWDGVIGAATVCPFPAFADATISLAASLVAGGKSTPPHIWTATHQAAWRVTAVPTESLTAGALAAEQTWAAAMAVRNEKITVGQETAEPESLTAAAAGLVPVAPPAEWFDDPELGELTPINVSGDGRVFGHAAAWDVCHIGIPGVCVTAPTSETDYSYFHLGEVECDDGTTVAVGHITLDTNHASRNASRVEATAHYDHTGTVVADLRAGEDEFGIWVAGALRPDADAEKVRKLRGSVLSGDWRDVNGNLELVALLAVNVPGFPIPRAPRAAASVTAAGEMHQLSLVAAGVHDGDRILTHVEAEPLDPLDEVRSLAARVAPTPLDEIRELAARAAA